MLNMKTNLKIDVLANFYTVNGEKDTEMYSFEDVKRPEIINS